MATTLNAVTSAGGGLAVTGDSSGVLGFQSAGTTYMTMDASGNLGVGTASPTGKLNVYGSSGIPWIDVTGGSYNTRVFTNSATTGLSGVYATTNNPLVFGTNNTENVRIDTSGNVGIGTSSPSNRLQVHQNTTSDLIAYLSNDYSASPYATYVKLQAANLTGSRFNGIQSLNGATIQWQITGGGSDSTIAFATGSTPTERMRIDSSGNLLIGRTNNPSGFTSGLYVTGAYSTTTPSGANVFINTDGSFFRSTSSIKYKTNVENYAKGLNDLSKLRPVTYQAKEGINTEQVFAGFVAEEVHEVGLTEFVQYAEDGTPDALSYGNMVALCVKAIQEQQELIKQLQADVAALKGAK